MSSQQPIDDAIAPPVPRRTKKTVTRVITKAPAQLPPKENVPMLRSNERTDIGSRNTSRILTARHSDVQLTFHPSTSTQFASNPRRELNSPSASSVRSSMAAGEGLRNSKSGSSLAMVHSSSHFGRQIPPGDSRELRLSPNKFVAPLPASVADQIVPLTRWPIRQRTSNSPPDSAAIVSNLRTRRGNEYVGSPSLVSTSTTKSTILSSSGGDGLPDLFLPNGPGVDLQDCRHDVSPTGYNALLRSSERKQSPSKQTDKSSTVVTSNVCQEGIVCTRCGKCRCITCTSRETEPSELPRLWIGEQECSARVALELCTCVRCVRCIFYHTRRSDEEDYSEDPCACTEKPACCGRWSAIALLAVTCLPCLVCYLPLRCAVDACTRCYNSRRNIGCRCQQTTPQLAGTKGLLTPESESSSY